MELDDPICMLLKLGELFANCLRYGDEIDSIGFLIFDEEEQK